MLFSKSYAPWEQLNLKKTFELKKTSLCYKQPKNR